DVGLRQGQDPLAIRRRFTLGGAPLLLDFGWHGSQLLGRLSKLPLRGGAGLVRLLDSLADRLRPSSKIGRAVFADGVGQTAKHQKKIQPSERRADRRGGYIRGTLLSQCGKEQTPKKHHTAVEPRRANQSPPARHSLHQ